MTRLTAPLLGVALLLSSTALHAWGREAHRAIGALALQVMEEQPRQALFQLLGSTSTETIVEWCIWPDAFRATDEGAWTAPLHFVNIPEGAGEYLQSRDCADDLCVTRAITRYAGELADQNLPLQQRIEAFAYVCHFVGDLSQPLHAGFASDRGATRVPILFHGQQMSLHAFWDFGLINTRFSHWQPLYRVLSSAFRVLPRKTFRQDMAVRWTNHSHRLAATRAYPEGDIILQPYEDQSWLLMRQQMVVGARNLATVLNSVLGQRNQGAQGMD